VIHVDVLKRIALYIVLLFLAWNWAVAENEVRNMTRVGASLGHGWRECMVSLGPRVDELGQLTAQAVGLSAFPQDPR